MDMIKNLETQAEKKRFNLNDLIHEDDIKRAEAAGQAAKMRDKEIEWHQQNDPNFEEWYAEECRKINEEWEAMKLKETPKEAIARNRHYRGL